MIEMKTGKEGSRKKGEYGVRNIIKATRKSIIVIGSREGSRNRRRSKANQRGKRGRGMGKGKRRVEDGGDY